MAKDTLDNQINGQMTIADLYEPPERLFAVSRIFARARKEMSLAEQKTFVYALSKMKFTEKAESNYIRLEKKTLANILGIHSDPDHLSDNLFRMIENLPAHSYIKIADKDLDLYASGFLVTNIISFKNIVRIKFEEDFMGLFTNLSSDYITMWSMDIFKMTSKRSVQFYEYLRQVTDTRESVNSIGLGVRALKEMFDIPKDGKGSYMREKGGFNRFEFEQKVIEPLCADLAKCKMINLIMQPDGKYYEKIKRGNRVDGYRFYWTISEHPAVATASEIKELQDRVDRNPQILKVAKDIISGEKNTNKQNKKKNSFNDFEQKIIDFDELEKNILSN